MTFRIFDIPLIVLCATALHLSWAVSYWLDPDSINATPFSSLRWMSKPEVLVALVAAGFLAVSFRFIRNRKLKVLVMLPQQALLFLSSGAAIDAIIAGHYTDGVPRSHGHLFTDQVLVCLVALSHMAQIIRESSNA